MFTSTLHAPGKSLMSALREKAAKFKAPEKKEELDAEVRSVVGIGVTLAPAQKQKAA